ncbi:MAG: arsenate reductase ArsC [Bryobacterales bacterium]|nr:arsenate reductase ArsC [Bryobacterales bacterium]
MKPVQVVFVCFGNACRSQMAEGFARTHGQDVMVARSAGLMPTIMIPKETSTAMREKGIDISFQFPKGLKDILPEQMELVINMSGYPLPGVPKGVVRIWIVKDPVGKKPKVFNRVRDEIEGLVMNLIEELRRARTGFADGEAERITW